jgi:hypothetical protein
MKKYLRKYQDRVIVPKLNYKITQNCREEHQCFHLKIKTFCYLGHLRKTFNRLLPHDLKILRMTFWRIFLAFIFEKYMHLVQ